MSSPQSFITQFRDLLRAAGIRFALTSGQACVYFGIQQTTKDSDWIVEPNDLEKFCTLLQEIDSSRGQRVSFRPICGAPISAEFLGNGWTTHVLLVDADGDQHHLDFFGRPPRVLTLERDQSQPDYASRFVVAQMKKTDREKDWPIVFALARQSIADGDLRGILHGQDAEWIINVWRGIEANRRSDLTRQRPLLGLIESDPHRLRRAVMIEKQIWQSVNRCRYRSFQTAWKEFFRQWRCEPNFQWPAEIHFAGQCACLSNAAKKYGLPVSPFSEALRQAALVDARRDATEIFAATDDELEKIVPPIDMMLP